MTTPPSLVEELLADQQSLTAVEAFSRAHDEHALAPGARYRNLIPLEAPRCGEQYAFEVELEKCSGCKACVTACHSLNGLDEDETWRDVGLLINAPKKKKRSASGAIPLLPYGASSSRDSASELLSFAHHGRQQHVTTACHHCVDPACLNGCPVLAYEKDSVTGIVRHLDDQCIGCQYCILKCPYDVPKYNARLGIVRKCDMCSNRLAVGEAPACVQACPNEAIRITKVQTESVTIEFRERREAFLVGAPAGDYTLPTTRYVTPTFLSPGCETFESRRFSNGEPRDSKVSPPAGSKAGVTLVAADTATLRPQPAHWPLVFMLVLSQASVGLVSITALQGTLDAISQSRMLWLALLLGLTGLTASIFHLGRPLGAWRAFLNLRRSWMSREIVLFAAYVPLLIAALFARDLNLDATLLCSAAALVGVLGIFSSMMLYHDTRRPLWNWRRSAPFFFGTVAILGPAAALAVKNDFLPEAILGSALFPKFFCELCVLSRRNNSSLRKTALLVTGRFQHFTLIRLACFVAGGIGLPVLATIQVHDSAIWSLAFLLLLAGELIERSLFFRAVDAPKMPGGSPA
jgi:Fe-S-cluster-containing dehydrogenase component/DMSO reductase anchor subunit